MDKLDDIFRLQEMFDTSLASRRDLSYSTEEWVQKETLAILAELGELLDEVNFKWWKNPHPVDRERVTEELVDILHFYVSMCLKVGLSAESLHSAYVKKNRENFLRQEGQSGKDGYKAP
ncbi:MAG: dUTPase [Firmicutes bacterium]|nr:dUTPase [Bacillota bacterium]